MSTNEDVMNYFTSEGGNLDQSSSIPFNLSGSSADISPFAMPSDSAQDNGSSNNNPFPFPSSGVGLGSFLEQYQKIHQSVSSNAAATNPSTMLNVPMAMPISSTSPLPIPSSPSSNPAPSLTTSSSNKRNNQANKNSLMITVPATPSTPTIISNNSTGHTEVIFNPNDSNWARPSLSSPYIALPVPISEKPSSSSNDTNSSNSSLNNILVPPNISSVLQNPTQTFSSMQLIAKSAESAQPSANFITLDGAKSISSSFPVDLGQYLKAPNQQNNNNNNMNNNSQQDQKNFLSMANPLKRKRQMTSEDVKVNHKNREKRRREELNKGLDDLKNLLPDRSNQNKETKTDLVADAVQHIKSLREALSSIMDERNRLDNEVLQLKTLLQRLLQKTGIPLEQLLDDAPQPMEQQSDPNL